MPNIQTNALQNIYEISTLKTTLCTFSPNAFSADNDQADLQISFVVAVLV